MIRQKRCLDLLPHLFRVAMLNVDFGIGTRFQLGDHEPKLPQLHDDPDMCQSAALRA
jgi:hypothetical protein